MLYLNTFRIKAITRQRRVNKITDFCAIQFRDLYNIIITTETWLTANANDAELSDSDFVLYREDRSGHRKTRRARGGLLCHFVGKILNRFNDEILILKVRPNKCIISVPIITGNTADRISVSCRQELTSKQIDMWPHFKGRRSQVVVELTQKYTLKSRIVAMF